MIGIKVLSGGTSLLQCLCGTRQYNRADNVSADKRPLAQPLPMNRAAYRQGFQSSGQTRSVDVPSALADRLDAKHHHIQQARLLSESRNLQILSQATPVS